MDEILWYDHSNENSSVVFSQGTFLFCGRKPVVLHSNETSLPERWHAVLFILCLVLPFESYRIFQKEIFIFFVGFLTLA